MAHDTTLADATPAIPTAAPRPWRRLGRLSESSIALRVFLAPLAVLVLMLGLLLLRDQQAELSLERMQTLSREAESRRAQIAELVALSYRIRSDGLSHLSLSGSGLEDAKLAEVRLAQEASIAEARTLLDLLLATPRSEQEAALLGEARDKLIAYGEASGQMNEMAQIDRLIAIPLMGHLEDSFARFAAVLLEAKNEIDAQATGMARAVAAEAAEVRRDFLLLAAALVAALSAGGFMIARSITKPLRGLTLAMQAITGNRLDTPIPATGQRNEIGAMAGALVALRESKLRLDAATADLEARNADLDRANRQILESIHYASRIQSSLLPEPRQVDDDQIESFVLFQQRDIVGGDYYWFDRFEDGYLFLVADCTGHGVPGALMTMIVATVLARVLHEYGHDDPALILQHLNRLVKSSLRQDRADAPSDDGLDAMIVFVSPQTRRLVYAGARLSLLYARGGEMMELKADRTSLGYKSCNADYIFANHVVTTEPEMAFYLATDGITDQVGGPRRRMFGRQRLTATLQTVQGRPMAEQRAAVLAAVESYQGGEARRDDRTLIGFRLRG